MVESYYSDNNQDHKCSQMIQSAMEEVTLKKTHWLSPIDLVDLAESFIYDSDTKSCHRDVEYGARQLQ